MRAKLCATLAALALLTSCGGGGTASTTQTQVSSTGPAALLINSCALPVGLEGKPYSATLQASGGTPPYNWAMSQNGPGPLPSGLGLDASSGKLSGIPTFTGFAAFLATVTDSSGRKTTAGCGVQANPPLASGANHADGFEYQYLAGGLGVTGGIAPFRFSMASGNFPPGVNLDKSVGNFQGTPVAAGTFTAMIEVQDSYSTPEVISFPFTLNIEVPVLSLAASLASRLALNQPYSGKVLAVGGIAPYSFAVTGGTLPPGMAFDPGTATVSGTPNSAGSYTVWFAVTDSATPAHQAQHAYAFQVAAARGRNDSVATATPIGNGSISASISPYEDPPASASQVADRDFYETVAQGGQIVHLQTTAIRTYNGSTPLDLVIAVRDANGNLLSTCRPPDYVTDVFTSVCVNDDAGGSQDSLIDVQVPGPPTSTQAIYVEVLDWRGDARPDMPYTLLVSGALDPLHVQTPPASIWTVVGQSGTVWTFTAAGGGVPYTWSVVSGSLPPGLTLDPTGTVSGTPTTAGSFPVTVQVTDMLSKTLPVAVTFNVATQLSITSTGPLPDGTAGAQYTYQFTSSGGGAPIFWLDFGWTPDVFGSMYLDSSGKLSGISEQAGNFSLTVAAGDQSGQRIMGSFALTMHPASSLTVQMVTGNPVVNWPAQTPILYGVHGLYGTPPYTFALVSGALPVGVSLNSNGSFAGTPTTRGTYTFTVSAADSSSPQVTGTGTMTITIY